MPVELRHFAAPRFGTQDHVLRVASGEPAVFTDESGKAAWRVSALPEGLDITSAGDPLGQHYVLNLIA